MKKEHRICKKHGVYVHSYETCNKCWRCNKCRTEAVQRRRDKLKVLAVEYKGGRCSRCGYDKCIQALDFHHRDSKEKEFGIARKGITRSWASMKVELDKCDLVCANCHREIHAKD